MPKKIAELPNAGTIKRLRLSNLTAASYNPRVITDDAFRGLRESLSRFGMLEMPVVNVIDGEFRLVSGHQRVSALVADGIEFADCLLVKLDAEQEKIANLTMNNPAIRGTFDAQKAIDSIPDLSSSLPRPDYARFDALIDDLRKRADRVSVSAGAEAAETGKKSEGKPKSKTGQIYVLGKHRLFCGSFHDGVPALLGKKKAAACVTDPPYNVNYAAAWGDTIEGDDQDPEKWNEFVLSLCKVVRKHTDGPLVSFISFKEMSKLHSTWMAEGGAVLRWLFWVKDRLPFGPAVMGRRGYLHQSEPVMVGHAAGSRPHVRCGLSDVLECPKPPENALHPTQKPIALIRSLLEVCTDGGDLVLDPFLGSGTTLVVSEELGRVCFGCEVDPRFADVIRKRWAEQVHGEGADWVKLTPAA